MSDVKAFAPTNRSNLKKGVAQHIRDLILAGELRPGVRLDQNALADSLGVSRVPVREALITLETEGLVTSISRRGSFVSALEPVDIVDHYEMYGRLSGMAAARVSQSERRTEVLAQLDDLSARMRATSAPEDLDALNYRFHQVINHADSSQRLRAVLRSLANSMPTQFYGGQQASWCAEALDEHDFIVKCIRNGDGHAASAAMVKHFQNTGEQAVQRLRATGFWDEPDAL